MRAGAKRVFDLRNDLCSGSVYINNVTMCVFPMIRILYRIESP